MTTEWEDYRSAGEKAFAEKDFAKAEVNWRKAREIAQTLDKYDPRLTTSLEGLAETLWHEGKLEEAEQICNYVLHLFKVTRGPSHADYGVVSHNLAMLCHFQGKNALAEQNYKRALETLGKALGSGHPLVVAIATNYSDLLRIMGRDKESELMKNRALTTSDLAKSGQFQVAQSPAKRESAPPVAIGGLAQPIAAASAAPPPPQVAVASTSSAAPVNLMNADILQTDQRSTIPGMTPEDKWDNARLHAESAVVSEDWPKAEFFWQAAVRAAEVFPIRDPRLCKSLESLAEVYWKQGKYDQAEPLSRRVLSIYEAVLGENHPDVGFVANNLGMLYHAQGDMPKAASLYERALPLLASKLGPQHPSVFNLETNLKNVLMTLGRMDEAEVVKAKLNDSQQGRWTRSGKFQTFNMKDSDVLAKQT